MKPTTPPRGAKRSLQPTRPASPLAPHGRDPGNGPRGLNAEVPKRGATQATHPRTAKRQKRDPHPARALEAFEVTGEPWNFKKMGPGSGPELGPTTPPTDAVAAREKLVNPSFRAGISGPKTGSNPGPPFFKKQRKRTEKISPATTALIVAPMLWEVGSTLRAPCSRDQLRRHRARPLPGLAPTSPRGAGGPCEPSPSACRRCQLHAGSVRP